MSRYSYFYLLTNFNKTVLYAGVTSKFSQRLKQHVNGEFEGFSKKYQCKYLVYYEKYENINDAIFREKQVKKWSRKKKEALINKSNPDWKSLNDSVFRIDEEYL
ncbi:MAG: GIY-YIG nuclease family protein [Bacteroidota bacterium]